MSVPILALLLMILAVLAVVAAGVIVVVASRRRAAAETPRCGNCGYNLTGAVSNRCPECGKLFIEAGVITREPTPSTSRGVIRVVVLVLVGFTVLGVLAMILTGMRASTARARAVAARQAAVQAQMQAQAAAQQATTTAPAVEDGKTDLSPEAP